jgi:hypothetical protein
VLSYLSTGRTFREKIKNYAPPFSNDEQGKREEKRIGMSKKKNSQLTQLR